MQLPFASLLTTTSAGLLVVLCSLPLASRAADTASAAVGVYDVRSFGATGNGKTLDTAAIQHAIDSAAGAGGGTVRLSRGVFLSGTIRLTKIACSSRR